jgi:uncharacterized membrane-anchored protein YjiN (DUF445 family)
LWSLAFAVLLVVAGRWLAGPGLQPFWGGLVAAFGEAALVGGLADWFAVRALFAHPFGIPFPHTALIPRNRRRIIQQIRDLVVREWLPLPLLKAKVESFDLVGRALLPIVELVRPQLRDLIRRLGKEALAGLEARPVAELIAGGLSRAASGQRVAPFLAGLVRRAREEGWLHPVAGELVRRLKRWVESPASEQFIRARLDRAATAYSERDLVKLFTISVAELVGGLDLDEATAVIQGELKRFADEQLATDSQLHALLGEALTHVERRLLDDPEAVARLHGGLIDAPALAGVLEPVVASLRDEAGSQLDRDDSPWVDMAVRHVEGWLARLAEDAQMKERVNRWARGLAVEQLEANHHLLGALAQEQMEKLDDESLTALIQQRVGEDLNWIRLNGTFVGGLIGVANYLAAMLAGGVGR